MIRFFSLTGILLAVLFAGCATPTPKEAAATANFGPAPASTRQVVQEYFATTAFQPGSVKILAVGQAYKGYSYDPAFISKGQNFGWGIAATISANDQGGYPLGPKNYVLYYRNGKVLNSYEIIAPQTPGNWVRPIAEL